SRSCSRPSSTSSAAGSSPATTSSCTAAGTTTTAPTGSSASTTWCTGRAWTTLGTATERLPERGRGGRRHDERRLIRQARRPEEDLLVRVDAEDALRGRDLLRRGLARHDRRVAAGQEEEQEKASELLGLLRDACAAGLLAGLHAALGALAELAH